MKRLANSQNSQKKIAQLQAKIKKLEKEIEIIQQSTRTDLKCLSPLHNLLRSKFRFYYNWHLKPYCGKVHLWVLIFYTLFIFIFSFYLALHPQGPIKAAGNTFTDTDWSGGNYDSISDTDTENSSGRLLLKNDPSTMVLLGTPTKLPFVTDITSYNDKLLLLASTSPANVSDAELSSYDPVTNTYQDISYYKKGDPASTGVITEQGTGLMRLYNNKVYIPGYDPDGSGEDWSLGNLYIYDGNNLTKKRTIPNGVHSFDAAYFQGKLYVVSFKPGFAPPDVSFDDGNTWQAMSVPGSMTGNTGGMWVYNNKLYIAGAASSTPTLFIYDGTSWQTKSILAGNPFGEFLGKLYTRKYVSSDGINFSSISTFSGKSINDYVIYDNKLYASVTENSSVSLYVTPDGTNWTTLGTGTVIPYNFSHLASFQGRLLEATGVWNGAPGQAKIYVSSAKSSGYLVSKPKNLNPFSKVTLSWNATNPAGTDIKFQIRTAKSQTELSSKSFIGPDETTASYFTTSGQSLSNISGDSWVQYKVFLSTTDSKFTPYLDDLTITTEAYQPKSYYVAKSGSDSNPGTEAQPWLTIQKAANTMVAGDTVYVKAGTYNERVIISNSGTSGNRILFKVFASDNVIVSNGFSLSGSYLTVDGFEITPGNVSKPNGVVDFLGKYNIAENLYIHDLSGSGAFVFKAGAEGNLVRNSRLIRPTFFVDFLAGSIGNTIESIYVEEFSEANALYGSNNVFKNSTINGNKNGSDVLYPSGSGNLIKGNKIYGIHRPEGSTAHTDIFQWWAGPPTNLTVEGNILGSREITPWGSGDPDNSTFMINTDVLTSNIIIRNNIFLGERAMQINQAGGQNLENFQFYNNLFYSAGIQNYANAINWTFRNNIYVFVGAGSISGGTGTSSDYNLYWNSVKPNYEGSHSFEANPLFVNPDISAATNYGVNADWHLLPGSPAIDAGTSDGAPATDLEGNLRYDDPNTPNTGGGLYPYYDIGAYEYQGAGGDTIPPSVSILSPSNGATVSGIVDISASATDNVAISKVEFYIDTTLKQSQTTPGGDGNYGFGWDSTTVADGSHIIKAKAIDSSGLSSEASISIKVLNNVVSAFQIPSYSISPSKIASGEEVTFNFSLKNISSSSITLDSTGVAVRYGQNYVRNFPQVTNITINPNETYNYSQKRTFKEVGNYRWWLYFYWQGKGYRITGYRYFYVYPVVSKLRVSSFYFIPSYPRKWQRTWGYFTLRNDLSYPITLNSTGIAVRYYTRYRTYIFNLPYFTNLTLNPGQARSFVSSRKFPYVGSYKTWVYFYFKGKGYPALWLSSGSPAFRYLKVRY